MNLEIGEAAQRFFGNGSHVLGQFRQKLRVLVEEIDGHVRASSREVSCDGAPERTTSNDGDLVAPSQILAEVLNFGLSLIASFLFGGEGKRMLLSGGENNEIERNFSAILEANKLFVLIFAKR